MLRFLCVVFCCCLPTFVFAADRVALVLGQDRYEHLRPLANPVNDAVAIETRLRDLGFDVYLETNRDRRRMLRALDDFSEDAKGADLALVFFAGHGMEVAGRNYLMPLDVQLDHPEALANQSIALDDVVRLLGNVARSGVLIVDACRTDPFGGSANAQDGRSAVALRKPATVKPGMARIGRADGLLYAFAAAPGQAALDGSGGNSPFTEALLRHLDTPGLEIRSVFSLVQQDVYERTKAQQLPYVESGLPRMVFAAGTGDLPERDRLLLQMAELHPDDRAAVERIAAKMDMPLAPLFGALISADLNQASHEERDRELTRAAEAFVALRTEMRGLRVEDPRVAELRAQAETQMSLGAFNTARDLIGQAAGIDRMARETLKDNLVARTLSEAESMRLSAGMAETNLQRDMAIADYKAAVTLYDQTLALTGEVRVEHFESIDKMGKIHTELGDLVAAKQAYEIELELAQKRLATSPNSNQWMRNVAFAHGRLGELALRSGDRNTAQVSFSKRLEILRNLSLRFPSVTLFRRELSKSLQQSADLAFEADEIDAARILYHEGLKVARGLASSDPKNLTWKRDLAVSQLLVGDVEIFAGDVGQAKQMFQEALKIFEILNEAEPSNMATQDDLSSTYDRLSQTAFREGQTDVAFDFLHRAIQIERKNVTRDPDSAERQRNLSIGLSRLGDYAAKSGKETAARSAYQEALTLRISLATMAPHNTEFQRDLAYIYQRIGNFYFDYGETPRAQEAYEESISIQNALTSRTPSNTGWLHDLAVSYQNLGLLHLTGGDLVAAREAFQASRAVAKSLTEKDQTNSKWQRDLSISHENLGDIAVKDADLSTARTHYRASLAITKPLTQRDPSNTLWQRELSIILTKLGDVAVKDGDLPAASAAYQDGLQIRKTLAARNPENTKWQWDVLISHYKVSTVSETPIPPLRQAVEIGLTLEKAGRLTSGQKKSVAFLTNRLAKLTQNE